jgi:hypothetical protein
MVDLALSSMALAVFSRTQQHPPAATEAASRYYRLLQVVQERIAQVGIPTCDERNIDACLLTVLIMGRYEGAMHRPADVNSKDSFKSLQSWSHHDGAMAILKVWNDRPTYKTPTCIITQTRRGLIRSALLRNLPLPDWMLNGNRFGEHNLELGYDRIAVRIVNLRYASAILQQKDGLQIAEAEELNKEARELHMALQEWAAQMPSTWSYQRRTLAQPGPWPRRHFYSSIVYSYSNLGYAAVWSQYFAVSMLINSTRLKILELSCPNPLVDVSHEQQRLECVTQVKAMADGLASTIPFCLERLKADNPNSPNGQTLIRLNTNEEIKPYVAGLAVWPLTIAASLEGIDVRQQLWFRSELATLGRIVGDGVLERAETNQWAIL